MRHNPTPFLLLLALAINLASVSAAPHTLQRAGLVVTIEPEIGRLTEFRRSDGENIFCVQHPSFNQPPTATNSYVARGGERLWPTQQFIWRFWAGPHFLPDEAIDGLPWKTLTVSTYSITIESQTSSWLGLIARRTITLQQSPPALQILTTLKRVTPSQIPVHAWSISTVHPPLYCLLDIAPEWRGNRSGWTELSKTGRLDRSLVQAAADSIHFTIPRDADFPKVGTLGRWLAAVYPREILLLQTDFHPRDCYPDNSSMQVFVCKGFTEVETLSPNRFLQPGEELISRSTWQLFPRPDHASDRELKAEILRRVAAPVIGKDR